MLWIWYITRWKLIATNINITRQINILPLLLYKQLFGKKYEIIKLQNQTQQFWEKIVEKENTGKSHCANRGVGNNSGNVKMFTLVSNLVLQILHWLHDFSWYIKNFCSKHSNITELNLLQHNINLLRICFNYIAFKERENILHLTI